VDDSQKRDGDQDAPGGQQGQQVLQVLTEGGSHINRDANVDGDFIGRDQWIGTIINFHFGTLGTPKLSPDDVKKILRDYLDWVQDYYDQARLFGMRAAEESKRLTAVFVPQTLRRPNGEEIPLSSLLTVSKRIALRGGVGSGKSAILRHVAATLAGNMGFYGIAEDSPPIPLVIELREYITWVAKGLSGADSSWAGFMAYQALWKGELKAPKEFFDGLLRGGHCVLLVDGLDEVINGTQRKKIRQKIEDLDKSQLKGNRVIVAAREASFRELEALNSIFTRLNLQPYEEEQVIALVGKWCETLDLVDPCGKRDGLVSAIREINAKYSEEKRLPLFCTPLMATMAVRALQTGRELPRERAKLYDACVEAILDPQYNRDADIGMTPSPVEEVRDAGGDWKQQREWLSELALTFQRRSQGSAVANPIVDEETVQNALTNVVPEPPSVEKFLRAVKERGGLFWESSEGWYEFLHRSILEFLAARRLALMWLDPKRSGECKDIIRKHIALPNWPEVVLLMYGFMRIYEEASEQPKKDSRNSVEYLDWLSRIDGNPEVRLAGTQLAGAALLEIECPDPTLRRRQADYLRSLLEDSWLSVPMARRIAAGRTLAGLGDPRDGVGLGKDGLPDIDWRRVPADSEVVGETAPERQRPSISRDYRISRYPITNAQFSAFVKDRGYEKRELWTEEGWAWKGDRPAPLSTDSYKGMQNHPVVNISWYEAVAFCNWLSERFDYNISLPTEMQWERAARGESEQLFPWGDNPVDADLANHRTGKYAPDSTSAVGIFPKGLSPHKILDMSGNVWEWCRTKWRDSYTALSDDDDGLEGIAARVIRGGSFENFADDVRCASRLSNSPFDVGHGIVGFRVVWNL
jgi:formylglycine-generating enzyme required for sulfatase activity